MAIALQTVMCQVRSLYLPDVRETTMVKIPASKYGGQVRTSVMTGLKPSVLTTEGKKFLKPFALRNVS